MKRKNSLDYPREKIKVDGNGKQPIGIDIIESLQAFIHAVPAKRLSLFMRVLFTAFRTSPTEEGKRQLFKGDIKYLKRLQKFLKDIDTLYDQTELRGGYRDRCRQNK